MGVPYIPSRQPRTFDEVDTLSGTSEADVF